VTSAPDTHPAARAMLVWMQQHSGELPGLLADEARHSEDRSPAGDAAIRGHLRFVARALAANAAPGREAPLERFADGLPEWLDGQGERLDDALSRVGEAAAMEAALQFGSDAGVDPGMRTVVDRRVRIGAWTRVFLEGLDETLGGAPVSAAALAWMSARQEQLANTIFAMDRRAKQAEMDRGGPDAIADSDTVNRIGQAVVVQAHTRFLVEALAATMSGGRG
jgi:hypothetical protein